MYADRYQPPTKMAKVVGLWRLDELGCEMKVIDNHFLNFQIGYYQGFSTFTQRRSLVDTFIFTWKDRWNRCLVFANWRWSEDLIPCVPLQMTPHQQRLRGILWRNKSESGQTKDRSRTCYSTCILVLDLRLFLPQKAFFRVFNSSVTDLRTHGRT